ncbi:MAG: hypothetical protein IJY79_05585 [Clostridia bacterium]|nr:hypothetical protein [Clostridia bacterium]
MKINLNKSTKRALSLVLAFAVALGSLFTANIGVNITADAATDTVIWTYSGTPATSIANVDGGDGSSADKAIIIASAEELAYLAQGCGNDRATKGKYYRIADGVDAIVLQDTEAEAKAIMALTTTELVTTYFTDNKSSLTKWVDKAWVTDDSYGFEGVLDGNCVTVYGMYSIPSAYNYSSGLFPDIGGATIKNLAIKNSYVKGNSSAVLSAYSALSDTITVQGCEFINNVVINERNPGSIGHGGVIFGAVSSSKMAIDNCIVYGNIAKHASFELEYGLFGSNNGGTISNSLILDVWPSAVARSYASSFRQTYTNVYSNMWYNGATHTYTDNTGTAAAPVYTTYEYTYAVTSSGVKLTIKNTTDSTVADISEDCTSTNYPHNVTYLSSDDAKGTMGKLAMSLNWADPNGTQEEGVTYWYPTADGYPTVLTPDNDDWKKVESITPWTGNAATSFAGGTGVEDDPYLIETPEQLYKMVVDGGKKDGSTPAYYKVKDGVTDLYLSRAISGGYAAAKALASGTDYHNWNTGAWTVFEGNFDGNGVTIRGMISKSTDNFKQVGLVGVFGEDAVVKNINFDTCYAYNSSAANAALLASQVIYFGNEDADSEQTTDDGGSKDGYNLIYNVSVRNSSIQSNGNTQCAGLVASYNGNPDMLQVVNCLYDGYTCELGNGVTGTNANAGLAAYSWAVNNAQFSGCVSLGAPIASNRTSDVNYNDYRTDRDGAQYTSTTSGAKSYVCHPVYTFNCYTDIKETTNTTAIELVDESGASLVKAATADETLINNMPLLDWVNGWYIATDADGRKVPMPRVRTAADVPATWDTGEVVLTYNILVGTADGGAGGTPYNGRYGQFDKFVGSGTEADPYIISTPLELARAIGAGGTNLNSKLYFKLVSDIDVSGMPWLDTVGSVLRNGEFTCVPFEGVLDGDGHTVTGLYAVSNDGAAGLIPELASIGVVKNLHIRNSYIGSSTQYQPYKEVTDDFGTATEIDAENPVDNTNTAGAIAGITAEGAQIIGCSVANTTVLNSENQITADGNATVTNSYIDATYYDASGAEVIADAITVDYGTGAENPVWYKGGAEGSVPRLVNRAAAMTEVDVAGDDNTDYGTEDLVALRNKLLRKSAYQNIYGDVSKNGVVNSNDLVILRRAMATDYEDIQDGFWRNVELGKVKIYYGENDNYDAARKLELYLESLYPGIDVQKLVSNSDSTKEVYLHEGTGTGDPDGTADGYYDIIVGDVNGKTTTCTDNNYAITYENDTLWLQGANFTGVEQAVLDYVEKTVPNAQEGGYTVASATLDSNKWPVTVGDTTYYYAWGDEFAETESETISGDNWQISSYRFEQSDGSANDRLNKENPNLEDLKTLWVVRDGQLQIWRGVNTAALTEDIEGYNAYSWGYKGINLGVSTDTTTVTNDWGAVIDSADAYIDPGLITTKNSMLFKQGYVEMVASLPSDGHAFPAWWFLTYTGERNNNNIASSLYGKVFKENSGWDKTTVNAIPTTPTTYKYQLPTAHLEFDIVELMQNAYGTADTVTTLPSVSIDRWSEQTGTGTQTRLTGNYDTDNFVLTVHKLYTESVYNDQVYQINWDNLDATAIYTSFENFNSTQGAGTWSHRYNEAEFVNGTGLSNGITSSQNKIDMGSLSNLTGTHKYGFAWKVEGSTYSLDLYVDDELVTTINQETGHAVSDKLFTDGADSEIWNQYAYMLLDNAYYTYEDEAKRVVNYTSPFFSDSWSVSSYEAWEGAMYTDLLSQNTTNGDKATFEVQYVRVYQENDKRDIVTRETEAFNNGNHFSYGE